MAGERLGGAPVSVEDSPVRLASVRRKSSEGLAEIREQLGSAPDLSALFRRNNPVAGAIANSDLIIYSILPVVSNQLVLEPNLRVEWLPPLFGFFMDTGSGKFICDGEGFRYSFKSTRSDKISSFPVTPKYIVKLWYPRDVAHRKQYRESIRLLGHDTSLQVLRRFERATG